MIARLLGVVLELIGRRRISLVVVVGRICKSGEIGVSRFGFGVWTMFKVTVVSISIQTKIALVCSNIIVDTVIITVLEWANLILSFKITICT